MSSLRELYQEVIIDHSKNPRNSGKLACATHLKEGFNPLCGDRLTIHIMGKNSVIAEIAFEGSGCAISLASASLMTEALRGKTFVEAEIIFNHFHQLVTTGVADEETLGKLMVLAGVRQYPVRVKCATLAWHTLIAAITNVTLPVSTE
jgi:nitrogen fixation NifU-like protein